MLFPIGLMASTSAITAPLSYLLDDMTAPVAAAYSMRKLRSGYAGSCLRVMRSNDNAQLDIGFDAGGYFDAAAASAFGAGNSLYVPTWYDQSGNARNLTASSQMPSLYEGSFFTLNSKRCINCHTRIFTDYPATTFSGMSSSTAITCWSQNSDSNTGWSVITSMGQLSHSPYTDGNAYENYLADSRPGFGTYPVSSDCVVHTANHSGSALSVFRNGSQIGSPQTVGFSNTPSVRQTGEGLRLETILTNGALSTANRQIVERSMGAYFGVTVA